MNYSNRGQKFVILREVSECVCVPPPFAHCAYTRHRGIIQPCECRVRTDYELPPACLCGGVD